MFNFLVETDSRFVINRYLRIIKQIYALSSMKFTVSAKWTNLFLKVEKISIINFPHLSLPSLKIVRIYFKFDNNFIKIFARNNYEID